jgi:branched-subunit amino acid transport protein
VTAWIALVLAGIGSYALRVSVVAVIDRVVVPPWLERVSAYIMPAVFAGLAAVALADPLSGDVATALPVTAGSVTTVVIARRRTATWALLAGMSALWLTSLLLAVVTPS